MITIITAYIIGIVSGFLLCLLLIYILRSNVKKRSRKKKGRNIHRTGIRYNFNKLKHKLMGKKSNVVYLSEYRKSRLNRRGSKGQKFRYRYISRYEKSRHTKHS